MPNLLIIEPHCGGHRARYVNWIAKGAVERGFHVQLVTLPSSACHPIWLELQEATGPMFQMITLQGEAKIQRGTSTAGLIRREFAYWRLLNRAFEQCARDASTDFVIVPYLDYCANAVAILGSPFNETRWSGIVMRQAFHFVAMGLRSPASAILPIKERLFLRLLRNRTLKRVFTIDETLVTYIDKTRPRISKRLRYLMDPAELCGNTSQEEARQILGIPADSHVMLVYGYIDVRKGVDALLKALQNRGISESLHVVFAGQQGESGEKLLGHPDTQYLFQTERIHMLNKFLDENEEYAVFKAASIVWLGYRGHFGMSGIMVQAGQMSLPIIACKEGLIGWLTQTNELGVVVDIDDPVDVSGAVESLTENSVFASKCGANGARKFSQHTVGSFVDTIFQSGGY